MAVIERRCSPRGVPRSFYMHNYLQNEVTTMRKEHAGMLFRKTLKERFCDGTE